MNRQWPRLGLLRRQQKKIKPPPLRVTWDGADKGSDESAGVTGAGPWRDAHEASVLGAGATSQKVNAQWDVPQRDWTLYGTIVRVVGRTMGRVDVLCSWHSVPQWGGYGVTYITEWLAVAFFSFDACSEAEWLSSLVPWNLGSNPRPSRTILCVELVCSPHVCRVPSGAPVLSISKHAGQGGP